MSNRNRLLVFIVCPTLPRVIKELVFYIVVD